MLKIVVASKNPVKLNAAKIGFEQVFKEEVIEVIGVSAPSEVSDQPMSDQETYAGALNRANNAKTALSEQNQEIELDPSQVDYWVGIEGGIEDIYGEMRAFAWIVVVSKDNKVGSGKTGTFSLPEKVAELVRGGMELGQADDVVFQRSNSKQENGAVGILTGDLITRESFYVSAVMLSLIPHINQELY